MDQLPTIVIRISANPINDQLGKPDPLIELVSVETIVNSTPSLNRAVREFVKRHYPVRLGRVHVQRV